MYRQFHLGKKYMQHNYYNGVTKTMKTAADSSSRDFSAGKECSERRSKLRTK